MKDRIRDLMESLHKSQQEFAQMIEMSPASLSSIFNGRTKPTLTIVEAIRTQRGSRRQNSSLPQPTTNPCWNLILTILLQLRKQRNSQRKLPQMPIV